MKTMGTSRGATMSRKQKRMRLKPVKPGSAYRQLWRIVDGAVKDCFMKHPDYLTGKGHAHSRARNSVNKRVVGAILGYTQEVASGVQSRSGRVAVPPAADSG